MTATTILGGFQTDFARVFAREGHDIAELVREVVGDTIATMMVAGQPIYNALDRFEDGDEAFLALEFKQAFDSWVDAYAEAVK